MTYIINYTDKENKEAIEVFDNTTNKSTSLTFTGRNVTGYAQIVGENLLHLLENFAGPSEPVGAVEGQLWYDNLTGSLMLNDGSGPQNGWKFANGIQKGPVEPDVTSSKVGELWVDTANQQLRIYSGTQWILVGPERPTVVDEQLNVYKTGFEVETIFDVDNIKHTIVVIYDTDVPVIIFSKDSFVPKLAISGFPALKSGINLPILTSQIEGFFTGGFLPKLYGAATSADALNVPGESTPVSSGKFLRTDKVNTVEYRFNFKTDEGIVLGNNGSFKISNDPSSAKLYNSEINSPLDFQVNRNGSASTVLRISDNKVGINNLDPQHTLDVGGDMSVSGPITVLSQSTESIDTAGGIRVSGQAVIAATQAVTGAALTVGGTTELKHVYPGPETRTYDLGSSSRKWRNIWAKTIDVEELNFSGILNASISGNADTANSLKTVTTFKLSGDVISNEIRFNGAEGQPTKIFDTQLTSNIISSKSEPIPNVSNKNDYVLTWRQGSGLLKQTRDTFIGDLGVPIGTILPFAGAIPPAGYLLCDGSEVPQARYPALYQVIGVIYQGTAPTSGVNTFRLPDLRGRFALGKDNMDNNTTVQTSGGATVDAGGGNVDRIPDASADILGGTGGTTSVTIGLGNLPEHEHKFEKSGVKFSCIRVDSTSTSSSRTGLGPSRIGEAQYVDESGGIKTPPGVGLGRPMGIVNPYLTVNYIIRSGLPAN